MPSHRAVSASDTAPEAQAGMAGRRRVLGDTDPDGWQGGQRERLDVLAMRYARDEAARDEMLADHARRSSPRAPPCTPTSSGQEG